MLILADTILLIASITGSLRKSDGIFSAFCEVNVLLLHLPEAIDQRLWS